MRARSVFSAAVLLLLLAGLSSFANAGQYGSIIAYGDSLSDNGNLYAATGYPPSPYYNGRFSNGPVAVEDLSHNTNTPLYDFAWGGATTGVGNSADGGTQTTLGLFNFPGTQTQVAGTLSTISPIASHSLVIVWAGPDDFLTNGATTATADKAVSDLLEIVAQLQGIGVAKIVVPGMPNLGITPEYSGNPVVSAGLTALSSYFNTELQAELPKGVGYFDTFGLLDNVVANPRKYGFDNVADSCLTPTGPLTWNVCANPNQYLFWDDIHPTEPAQQILANGLEHAFVPEPSTFLMLGSGFAGLLGLARRRLLK